MKKENWFKSIDVATKRFRKPTHDQVVAVALELFPDEMSAGDSQSIRRGRKTELRDAMRGVLNMDESGEDAGVQSILPGMVAPAYIGVTADNDKETCPVKYMQARPDERQQAINQRGKVADRITKRRMDLEEKEEFLKPYISHDFETTEETLTKIAKEKKAS